MDIIWSEHSKADLRNFLDNVREGTEKSANNYILNLMDYTTVLKDDPYLGKAITKSNSEYIRQLIYRKHKILYTIYDDYILVLAVVHSSRNMDNFFKTFLSDNF